MKKLFKRMFCKHVQTVEGTQAWTPVEQGENYIFVYVTCASCGKTVGKKVVGYTDDGIYL